MIGRFRCRRARLEAGALTFLLLMGVVTTAAAQSNRDRDPITGDAVTCTSLSSASRTRSGCGEDERREPTVLRSEAEFTLSTVLPVPDGPQCNPELAIEYLQWDAIARVEGTIHNEACAAASGQYTITARIIDENGEIKTLEFDESWQRDDDQPVPFAADYPIGENVELIRLTARRIRCSCVDSVEE